MGSKKDLQYSIIKTFYQNAFYTKIYKIMKEQDF